MANKKTATKSDVVHVLGDLDDHKIVEILDLGANYGELEEAAEWLAREDEVMRNNERSLSGVVAAIFDIVSRDGEAMDEEESSHLR